MSVANGQFAAHAAFSIPNHPFEPDRGGGTQQRRFQDTSLDASPNGLETVEMKTGFDIAISTFQSLAARLFTIKGLKVRPFKSLPLHLMGTITVLVLLLGAVSLAMRMHSNSILNWLNQNAAYTAALNGARSTVDELILAEHHYVMSGESRFLERSTLLRRQLNAGLDTLEQFPSDGIRPKRSFPRIEQRYSGYLLAQDVEVPRASLAGHAYRAEPSLIATTPQNESHVLELIESQLESLNQSEHLALKDHLIRQQEWHQKLVSLVLALTLAAAALFWSLPILLRFIARKAAAHRERRAAGDRRAHYSATEALSLSPADANTSHLISAARAEERANIARDVHDELGSLLMAIMVDMKCSAKLPVKPRRSLDGQWPAMLERIHAAMAVVTNLAEKMRPSIIDQIGLLPAVESHLLKFEQYTKLACSLATDATRHFPNGQAATDAFMIFQEALTNIARHASASNVNVVLRIDDNELNLSVADDGKGIAADRILSVHSAGICGMSERAQRNGGMLHVEGTLMKGTTVKLTMPLPTRL